MNARNGNCFNKIAFFFPPGLIVRAVMKQEGKKENKEQALSQLSKQHTLTMYLEFSNNHRLGGKTSKKILTQWGGGNYV